MLKLPLVDSDGKPTSNLPSCSTAFGSTPEILLEDRSPFHKTFKSSRCLYAERLSMPVGVIGTKFSPLRFRLELSSSSEEALLPPPPFPNRPDGRGCGAAGTCCCCGG